MGCSLKPVLLFLIGTKLSLSLLSIVQCYPSQCALLSCSIDTGESPVSGGPTASIDQPQVIPSQGDLLGDLLNLDLGPPVNVPQVSSMQMGAVDLLGGGLDSLVGGPVLSVVLFCLCDSSKGSP